LEIDYSAVVKAYKKNQDFRALVISLLPGGPGKLSTKKPIDFKLRFTDPLAQYVNNMPPESMESNIFFSISSDHISG
jgi:hypothetical protein